MSSAAPISSPSVISLNEDNISLQGSFNAKSTSYGSILWKAMGGTPTSSITAGKLNLTITQHLSEVGIKFNLDATPKIDQDGLDRINQVLITALKERVVKPASCMAFLQQLQTLPIKRERPDSTKPTSIGLVQEKDVNLSRGQAYFAQGTDEENKGLFHPNKQEKTVIENFFKIAFESHQNGKDVGHSEATERYNALVSFQTETTTFAEMFFKFYDSLADENDAGGMYLVGRCHEQGIGTPQSNAKAFNSYKSSADANNQYGQLQLGRCYEFGIGTEKNPAEAFKAYKASAEQGNSWGRMNLGRCHEQGIGTAVCPADAYKAYRKSADQGNAEGKRLMQAMLNNGFVPPEEEKKYN